MLNCVLKDKMGRYTGKTCRLLSMLVFTSSFFLVEIVVGYVTNSIALVADSFHMLSDVVALIVGFASIRISKWPSRSNTYGWVRAEIVGALYNAVFLLALCFSILVESLQRLVKVEEIENPKLLLTVGALGLLVNIIGLLLFHGHMHGHSHGGEAEHHIEEREALMVNGAGENSPSVTVQIENPHGHSHSKGKKKAASSSQMNMKGVFLHVLGDALGSVIVIISSLVIWFAEGQWRFYVDPAMSIMMVCIILVTTIPLLKQTSLILLQTVPEHLDHGILKTKLEQLEGVVGVHEFHLWQLTSNRIVLSAHITCHNMRDYMAIAARAKEVFHIEGVHSTTIQPEFIDSMSSEGLDCKLICAKNQECIEDTCCGTRNKGSEKNKSLQESTPLAVASSGDQTAPQIKHNANSPSGDEAVTPAEPSTVSDNAPPYSSDK